MYFVVLTLADSPAGSTGNEHSSAVDAQLRQTPDRSGHIGVALKKVT
jgi:hypothetical protein